MYYVRLANGLFSALRCNDCYGRFFSYFWFYYLIVSVGKDLSGIGTLREQHQTGERTDDKKLESRLAWLIVIEDTIGLCADDLTYLQCIEMQLCSLKEWFLQISIFGGWLFLLHLSYDFYCSFLSTELLLKKFVLL